MKLQTTIIIIFILTFSAFCENLTSGEYNIIQSWTQEKSYKRQYYVNVPNNGKDRKIPVFIALHGSGGNAERMMKNQLRKYKNISQNYSIPKK